MVFTSHISTGGLGSSSELGYWWKWEGTCHNCARPITPLRGIFCQNFCFTRGNWTPCRFTSCPECYRDSGQLNFPVARAFNDESKYFKRRKEKEDKYLVGRAGDGVIAPFQCDRCWFINVHKRVPLRSSPGDQRALMLIRRVNLDVFWSREERTVSRVVGELKYIFLDPKRHSVSFRSSHFNLGISTIIRTWGWQC